MDDWHTGHLATAPALLMNASRRYPVLLLDRTLLDEWCCNTLLDQRLANIFKCTFKFAKACGDNNVKMHQVFSQTWQLGALCSKGIRHKAGSWFRITQQQQKVLVYVIEYVCICMIKTNLIENLQNMLKSVLVDIYLRFYSDLSMCKQQFHRPLEKKVYRIPPIGIFLLKACHRGQCQTV